MTENKPVLIALAVAGVLLLGFLVYYFTSESEVTVQDTVAIPEEKPPVVEVPEPTPMPEPTPEVAEEPEAPAFVLPRLDSSDQLIRDGAVSLTRHEGINTWLGSKQLIRKVVAFTDNVANGNIAKEPAAALAPRGQMVVDEVEEGVYVVNPRSYERFNNATNILLSLDTERSVEFYLLLRPLFQEAYEELGYPSGNFDQVVLSSIGRLLETPKTKVPKSLSYEAPKLSAMRLLSNLASPL
jgi:hypothetical protein